MRTFSIAVGDESEPTQLLSVTGRKANAWSGRSPLGPSILTGALVAQFEFEGGPPMIMARDELQREMFADGPRFQPGQLIRHKRYGYRGVIVAVDSECLADETWYQSNQSQPDRNQPWYHVLVHGGAANTYAAEGNLEPDPSQLPIDHPLIEVFFAKFQSGAYVRNDQPWPGS